MRGRDHARARQPSGSRQRVAAVETHQIGNEQEQPPGGELTRREHEVTDVGHGLGVGTDAPRTFLVEPARQGGEALVGQNLAHRRGAQRRSLLLERLADLIDRIVALAQRHDLLEGAALFGLLARAWMRGGEELRQLSAAEGVAQNAEGARRVAEAPGRFGRSHPFDEEGSHGLVLALSRGRGLDEEAAGLCYVIWYADRQECTVSHTRSGVKPKLRPQSLGVRKNSMLQRLSRQDDERSASQRGPQKRQMTVRNSDISALFQITQRAEILSRKNPLNELGVSGILRRGNPG